MPRSPLPASDTHPPAHATHIPPGIPPAELYRQMTTVEAAKYLGVPTRNLEAMRQTGTGPLFVRFSARSIRYRLIDLIRYQERMLRRSTCDVTGPDTGAAA
jgi:hypothetical protein